LRATFDIHCKNRQGMEYPAVFTKPFHLLSFPFTSHIARYRDHHALMRCILFLESRRPIKLMLTDVTTRESVRLVKKIQLRVLQNARLKNTHTSYRLILSYAITRVYTECKLMYLVKFDTINIINRKTWKIQSEIYLWIMEARCIQFA